jgi:indole-3-glycerol phosphate synthase
MEDFLEKIIKHKKEEIEISKQQVPLEKLKDNLNIQKRDFNAAISKNGLNLIAEIKKASPSRGIIRENFNYREIAVTYEKSSVSAISVLTDNKFFMGSLRILQEVANLVNIPVLRKDFIIDPYQIYETNVCNADALLLIVACLEKNQLSEYLGLAQDLHMNALVEVHNEDELDIALDCGEKIIGINNRDLKTFKIDLQVTFNLIKKIPDKKYTVVSESGINDSNDIEKLRKAGINAVLIGESLMRAEKIEDKIKEFIV